MPRFIPLAVLALGLASRLTATEPTHKIQVNGHTFTLPVGFEIELVAGPPLADRPITADLDEKGRLYVADSSGSNENVQKQLRDPTHRIVRLEDTNGDGKFDQQTVFADKMMFPEGTMWLNGSLYVAAPPHIWKLTDTDGDGIADKRDIWFDGKTLTGCANDLHGPYRGPDGYIYWTKGAFAEQTYTLPNGKPFKTKAAHIFRAKPDGSGLEPVMTGGMDNPVDVVFTPGGERIFSTTFLQHPAGGRRDGLIHAVYGAVYGKDHDPIYAHPWTAPSLMPPMTQLGAAAPSGLHHYESDQFGAEYVGNLFCTQFNMRKVSRHKLIRDGSTFRTKDHDFLVSDNLDFHPTDVIEDADGSLLVIDTGGWYKLCCPTSQLVKEDVLGAIYRVRKAGSHSSRTKPPAPPLPELYWVALNRDRAGLAQALAGLKDPDPHTRRLAAEALGRIGDRSAVPAILNALADESNDRILDHSLTFALIEIADPNGTAEGLRHNSRVRRAALVALDQMPGGGLTAARLINFLTDSDGSLREMGWWVAGRHPEWGNELADSFHRLIASELPANERDELAGLIAKFASSTAVERLLAECVSRFASAPDAGRVALTAMAAARLRNPPEAWYAALARLLTSGKEAELHQALATVRALPVPKKFPAEYPKALRRIGMDRSLPAELRYQALEVLPGGTGSLDPELFADLTAAIRRDSPASIRGVAAGVLSKAEFSPEQLRLLALSLGNAGPLELDKLLEPFARFPDETAALALIEVLAQPALRPAVRPDMLKPRLEKFGPAVQAKAEGLYAALNADLAEQTARIDRLLRDLPKGDVRRGQQVFHSPKAACASCHALGYLGGTVGPDLTKIGGIRTERDLLEAIVYPSASFVRSYEPVKVSTLDGRTIQGILKKDTADETIIMVSVSEEVRLARADIEEIEPGTVSVMPAGLDQQLSPQEMADLIAFLKAAK